MGRTTLCKAKSLTGESLGHKVTPIMERMTRTSLTSRVIQEKLRRSQTFILTHGNLMPMLSTLPSTSMIPKRSLANNSVKRDGKIEVSPFSTPEIDTSSLGPSEIDGRYIPTRLSNLMKRDCIPNL